MKIQPIKKILIANRGEIALRIIRSAHTMGIRTVAVYSDADARSSHVEAADEAVRIGPPEPAQSYLNIAALIEAAQSVRADSVHPGYGFLAERPAFAEAVVAAGMTFIGPPASVMAALGDKLAARRIAVDAGVPVVPGIEDADLSAARQFGDRVGFPILVKAAAGGGGRGMRVVTAPPELAAALEGAAREAQAAFGDGRVFLEKYLARPRHVEVQFLGDNYGTVVALGERDCSIQRRHQKIIEESPAPGLAEGLRSRLIDAAVGLARAAGYRNAGTAEFMVEDDQFYFLEVNARLQVEHPVTEIRFDRDLVCDQIALAAGERVREPITPHGHALECRINAEDPAHDFRPATGRVLQLVLPAGPGVRVDTHLTPEGEISPYYDSLIAKVICWGENREQARRRMIGALDEFTLLGVRHSAAFLHAVIASEPFAQADLSTRFLPEFFPQWRSADDRLKLALIAAMLAEPRGSGPAQGPASASTSGPHRDNHATRSPWTELGGFVPWSR